jgi:multiple sugar transport system ATP-binding protein
MEAAVSVAVVGVVGGVIEGLLGAVLRGGILQQFDTPQHVYAQPANLFVATVIGSPAMNVLEGRLLRGNGGLECQIGSYMLRLSDGILLEQPALARTIGSYVAAGIRPEAIAVAPADETGLRGKVLVAEELGPEVIAHIEIEATPVVRHEIVDGLAVDAPTTEAASPIAVPGNGRTTVVARLSAEAPVARDTLLSLTIDPRKMHFFDLRDGSALRA